MHAGGSAYEIGVRIALSGNAMQFLAGLGHALTGAHLKAKELEGGLNRAKMALGGMASIAAGVGLFKVMAHTAEKAGELSHALTQIQKLGIKTDQFDAVKKAAQETTRQVQGVNQVEALHAYGAAYSIFGHDDALKMMPEITKFEQVLGNTTGNYKEASEKVYSMIRAGELMGQFVDHMTHKVDVQKLTDFMSFASKAALATHGKVGPDQWLGMAQQGGPALSSMSKEGLMTMVAVAQAMGGPRAGTALMSASQQFLGGITTQRTAESAHKYGLVGDYDVRRGGKVVFKEGSLNTDFVKALREDPLQAMKIAQSAMAKRGITHVEDQVPELYKMFGRATTQRMFHDLLRNMPQIEAERTRIKGAMNLGDAQKVADEQDISKNIHNLSQAWNDFQATLGNSPIVVQALQSVTGAIRSMTTWAQENPGKMDAIRQGLIGLAAGLTALGVVLTGAALVAFVGVGGTVAAAVAGIAAAIGVLAALNWEATKAMLSGAARWLSTTWNTIAAGFTNDMRAIGTSISNGLTSLSTWVSDGFGRLGKAFIAAGQAFNNAISSAIAWVSNAISSIKGTLSNLGASIVGKITGSGEAAGAKAGAAVGAALAGARADGGFVGFGRSYLVGERGPEIFTPGGSGHITPNHRMAVGAPPKRGNEVTINNIMTLDGEVVHRSVERRMVGAATHPAGTPWFNGDTLFPSPDMQFAAG